MLFPYKDTNSFILFKYFGNFLLIVSRDTVSANGFGLAEGGEFGIRMFKFTIMLNRIPNVEVCTFAPLLANPCWQKCFLIQILQ